MILTQPFIITPRLQPGVKIGKAFISIGFSKKPGTEGRARYDYHIDTPNFEHSGNDLQSGYRGGSLAEGMASLMSFLSACGESYMSKGDNADLFPEKVAAWCHQHSDELSKQSQVVLALRDYERIHAQW